MYSIMINNLSRYRCSCSICLTNVYRLYSFGARQQSLSCSTLPQEKKLPKAIRKGNFGGVS